MPVEIYCPYENKRQRKRRRGIAQLSLSSVHGEKAFDVNRNRQENQPHSSGADDDSKTQAIVSYGVSDGTNSATTDGVNIFNDVTTATATATVASASATALKSAKRKLTPSRSIPIRRRRRKNEIKEPENHCEDKTEQKRDEKADDHDDSKNRDCSTARSSSVSDVALQSNFIAIDDANSKESATLKMETGTAATNAVAAASTDDHDIGRKTEVNNMLEMKEICSIEFFRATPLNEFRRRCIDCLQHTVLLSSRTSMPPPMTSSTSNCSNYSMNDKSYQVIRYDRLEIIRRLTNDIDWKSLCQHHDKREYKRQHHATNKSTKTAFCEILSAVTNPMVIPRCCRSRCLIYVLLNALLVSPSLSISLQRRRKIKRQQNASTATTTNMMLRWTPSQQRLLETIRRLLLSERMPLDSSMTDYVQNFVVSRPPFLETVERESTVTSSRNTTTMTPNKVNRLLSAIYWLLSSSLSRSSFLLFFERELVSSGLLLLQRIDGWNIQIDTGSEQQCIYGSCVVCNGDINDSQNVHKNGLRRPYNRKMTVETLSNLHDEAIDIENKMTQQFYSNNNMLWRRRYGHDQKQVSLKDVLAMKQNKKLNNNDVGPTKRCRCIKNSNGGNMNRKQAGETETTAISSDWSTVRSRAYKKFVSYTLERQRQQHLLELSPIDIIAPTGMKAIPTVQDSDEKFLRWLVHDAAAYQESSSRRVCLALVARSLGGSKNPCYFKYVARLFWQGYLLSSRQKKSSSSQWLRLYSEWLSECAVFDQREIAWEAIQPILEHTTECLVPNEQEQRDLSITGYASTTRKSSLNSKIPTTFEIDDPSWDSDIHEDNHDVQPSVMACLGYILHRRSHLFEIHRADEEDARSHDNDSVPKSSIDNDFQSFINLLAIHCGESPEPWLSFFSDSTRDLVESTLQRLGVLSFSISDSRKELKNRTAGKGIRSTCNATSDISMHSIATSNWPFSEEFSLRKAMGRIDRAVMSLENESDAVKSLLTHPTTSCQKLNQKKKTSKRSKRLMPSAPMTNYLHESGILCLIFSFCGPKRLAKIPQVCKAWKYISDTVSNTLWKNAYASTFGKYCWPCVDAEHRHLVATGAIIAIDFSKSQNKMENTSKSYWKNLFAQKHIAEKMVRFQRNPRSGYKHRTCNYVGCLHVLKSVEQERKHDQKHRRLLTKEQAALKKKKTSLKRKDNNGIEINSRSKKG